MPAAHASWTVLEHGAIEKPADNLWYVTGRVPRMAIRRVMTLVRLADGSVLVHSPIALAEDAMREVQDWGAPSVLVIPNRYHRLDAPAFRERYPSARVVCPRGARAHVQQVVGVDADYSEYAGDETVRLEHLRGVAEHEGVMTVHSSDGTTLVFTDAIFNMPHAPGFGGWLLRHVTASSGGPRVTRLAKLAFIKDKRTFRSHLGSLADTPNLVRVLVAHHEPILEHPARTLREIAAST